jgi:hypothetical protein
MPGHCRIPAGAVTVTGTEGPGAGVTATLGLAPGVTAPAWRPGVTVSHPRGRQCTAPGAGGPGGRAAAACQAVLPPGQSRRWRPEPASARSETPGQSDSPKDHDSPGTIMIMKMACGRPAGLGLAAPARPA